MEDLVRVLRDWENPEANGDMVEVDLKESTENKKDDDDNGVKDCDITRDTRDIARCKKPYRRVDIDSIKHGQELYQYFRHRLSLKAPREDNDAIRGNCPDLNIELKFNNYLIIPKDILDEIEPMCNLTEDKGATLQVKLNADRINESGDVHVSDSNGVLNFDVYSETYRLSEIAIILRHVVMELILRPEDTYCRIEVSYVIQDEKVTVLVSYLATVATIATISTNASSKNIIGMEGDTFGEQMFRRLFGGRVKAR